MCRQGEERREICKDIWRGSQVFQRERCPVGPEFFLPSEVPLQSCPCKLTSGPCTGQTSDHLNSRKYPTCYLQRLTASIHSADIKYCTPHKLGGAKSKATDKSQLRLWYGLAWWVFFVFVLVFLGDGLNCPLVCEREKSSSLERTKRPFLEPRCTTNAVCSTARWYYNFEESVGVSTNLDSPSDASISHMEERALG